MGCWGADPLYGIQTPETAHILWIVALMQGITFERYRVGNFYRIGPNAHTATYVVQHGHQALVELGYSHRLQRNGSPIAFTCLKDEEVFNEVEVNLQHQRAIGHR